MQYEGKRMIQTQENGEIGPDLGLLGHWVTIFFSSKIGFVSH